MSNPPPHTRDDLLAALTSLEAESVAYWNSFDDATFFAKIGEAWSPAENVRHLVKSIRPVVKALDTAKIILRLTFGRARRESMTYEALRARYQEGLDAGGQAGRFAPSSRAESDREAIMGNFTRVNRELREAIARWPEKKLDVLQLPHPLLGKLTVREMLFFTHYHQRHHMDVIRRRLAG